MNKVYLQTVFVVGEFPTKRYDFIFKELPKRNQVIKRLKRLADWDVNCDVHLGMGYWKND